MARVATWMGASSPVAEMGKSKSLAQAEADPVSGGTDASPSAAVEAESKTPVSETPPSATPCTAPLQEACNVATTG